MSRRGLEARPRLAQLAHALQPRRARGRLLQTFAVEGDWGPRHALVTPLRCAQERCEDVNAMLAEIQGTPKPASQPSGQRQPGSQRVS